MRPGYLNNLGDFWGTKAEQIPYDKMLKILTRQAARWATAANQDKNAMIAVLHANYGAAYLFAIKDIATAAQIRAATGIDPARFEEQILAAQDAATRKMAGLCPKYAPDPSYLTKIGGEGA